MFNFILTLKYCCKDVDSSNIHSNNILFLSMDWTFYDVFMLITSAFIQPKALYLSTTCNSVSYIMIQLNSQMDAYVYM